MSVKADESPPKVDSITSADPVLPDLPPPGLQESVVLALDFILAFVRLFKAEASLALSALPALVVLNIVRLPVYLLTWISFSILVATGMYTLTGSILLTAVTFFILQLGLALLLERQIRKTRAVCSMPESKKNMQMAIASLKERFKNEQGNS
ncbi:MAG: hypothetical protein V4628_07325 [Pseudomonadota bacterium]